MDSGLWSNGWNNSIWCCSKFTSITCMEHSKSIKYCVYWIPPHKCWCHTNQIKPGISMSVWWKYCIWMQHNNGGLTNAIACLCQIVIMLHPNQSKPGIYKLHVNAMFRVSVQYLHATQQCRKHHHLPLWDCNNGRNLPHWKSLICAIEIRQCHFLCCASVHESMLMLHIHGILYGCSTVSHKYDWDWDGI